MRAPLDDFAVMEHEDFVGVDNRAEPVGNGDRGAAAHELRDRPLDLRLDVRVDGAGGLVEDQQGRIGGHSTGKGQQLPLADAHPAPAFGQLVVPATGEPLDDPIGAHPRRRRGERLVVDVGIEPEVAGHVAREEKDVLLHVPDDRAEHIHREFPDIDAIYQNATALRLVETEQQVHDGGLARTRVPHERDLLAGRHAKADALKHPPAPALGVASRRRPPRRRRPRGRWRMILGDPLLPAVGEPHILEHHGHAGRPQGADPRVTVGRGGDARCHGRIEEAENALRGGHSTLQDVVLLGEILQRLKEATDQLQEGGHRADRDRAAPHPEAGGHKQTG